MVITPFTLKTTFKVAVLLSQLIFVGVIVTTASGPVCPVAPVAPVCPVAPLAPVKQTAVLNVSALAAVPVLCIRTLCHI